MKTASRFDSIVISLACNFWHLVALALAIGFSIRTYETTYMVVGIGGGAMLCLITSLGLLAARRLSIATTMVLLSVGFTMTICHFAVASAIVPT